jgi:hypothetical protein
MNGPFAVPSEACAKALAELEADPLDLTPGTAAHVQACLACSEARVAWLAQAEESAAQAPAGYFQWLPGRILAKLPGTPRRARPHLALWALAAGLLAAVGVGGFLAGRANRTPMVEATLVPPAPAPDTRETLPDTPFQEGEEDFALLPNLSPEETRRLMERVSSPSNQP